MTFKKWNFSIVAALSFLLSQSVFASDRVDYELELVDEKGNTHIQTVSLEIRNGEAFFEGDIFIGYVLKDGTISEKPFGEIDDVSPFAIVTETRKWLSSTIPYNVSNLSTTAANAVRDAMDTLENVSGLSFVVRTSQPDYINFTYNADPGALCSSPVGRRGGAQTIRLAGYCSDSSLEAQRTLMHEIMHSLGFYHEHSRDDRDDWIIVHMDNIQDRYKGNFDIIDSDFQYLTPYDKKSIMHYFRFTSSENFVYDTSLPMLTDIDNPNAALSGNVLSDLDKEGLQSEFGILSIPFLSAQPFYCYGQVELNWDSVWSASYYQISYGSGPDPYTNPYIMTTTSSTSYTVMNANESRAYSVKACSSDGTCSDASNFEYVHYYPSCM